MRSASTLLLLLAGPTACFRYVPTDREALAPGAEVSVDLTSAGTANVKPSIGDFVVSMEGRVTEASQPGLTLSLTSVRRRGDPAPSTWSGESIHLTPEDIHQVKRRELARGRTILASTAVGAVGVGLVYAIARATGLVSGTAGRGPPPNP